MITAGEHRTIAHTCQLSGGICAVISLALALLCLTRALSGQWEALAGLAVSAWLLWAANRSFSDADQHHSHAATLQEHTS